MLPKGQDILDIEVTPLSSACGAEIKGVDLTKELSEGAVRAIKAAWARHLVLVFRGQSITQEQQLRFASYFGELGNRRKAPEKLRSRAEGIRQDNEKVLLVSNIKVDGQPIGAFGEGEFWFHIDSGYTPRPYKYTFLFALDCPRAAATPCSPTCTWPTTRCRLHSKRNSGARRRSTSTSTNARRRPTSRATSATPAPLSSRVHHASRHRPQDAVRRPPDDVADRRSRR